jgi:hypothetical protein
MATTRAKTGNAKPRVFPKTEEAVTGKKATTSKANTSKPRAKKVATGRVAKPAAEKKVVKKKTPLKAAADKVNGAVLKAEGKVEGKPEKKVSLISCCFRTLRCFDFVREHFLVGRHV